MKEKFFALESQIEDIRKTAHALWIDIEKSIKLVRNPKK